MRINDDFSTNSQFLPRLAIDQSSGALGVCWHDARNDRADHLAGDIDTDNTPNTDTEFFCTASFTGGTSWLTNARVSGGASNQARANAPGVGLLDYGDYLALTFTNRILHPAWADNSNSTGTNPYGNAKLDIYTEKAVVSRCAADCSGNDQVTIDELVTAVSIMMGTASLSACNGADLDRDGMVTVNEINQAVMDALQDCPGIGGSALAGSFSPTAGSMATDAPQTTGGALATTVTTLTIGSVSGSRGATISIPVTLSGGPGGYTGAQLDVLYATAVLSVPNPTTPCTLTAPGMPASALRTSFPTSPPAPSGKKRMRVAVIDTANLTQFGNGAWVSCTFKIQSTAPLGGSTVAGELQVVSDAASRKLPSTVVNGVVTVR